MGEGVHRPEPSEKPIAHGARGDDRPGRDLPSRAGSTAAGRFVRHVVWRRAAAALAMGLLAAGCRHAAVPAATRPLEIDVPTEPATLDPRFSTDAVAVRVTRLVHAGLVRLDPDSLRPLPYVAKRWAFRDPLTLEVELRSDVRFHSGRAVTAADVCATLQALAAPALGSPHRAVVEAISGCEAERDDRLVVRVASPHATLITDLEVPILRADQARLPPRPSGDVDGLGPYRVERATPGAIELVPAEHSAAPTPAHAVVVRTVRDENARALRLLAGRADIAPNAISPLLWNTLAEHGAVVRQRAGANVTYLILQNARAPFDRMEIRRAVSGAIDRTLITASMFSGGAEPASTIFPPGSMAHPAGLAAPTFAPSASRPALETVGRTVTLLTSTDRFRATLARIMADQLAHAGLAVEVVPLDFGTLLQRLAAGDFDMATLQMPELTEPNLLRWFFHSSHIPSSDHPTAGANRARYRSADVDQWLDEARAELDEGRRAGLYARVAERLAADLPVLPLWHEAQVAVVSPRARSFELSAEGRWLSVASIP